MEKVCTSHTLHCCSYVHGIGAVCISMHKCVCDTMVQYVGTRIQRNVLLEVCIVYVYSELRVVSLAAGKAFVDVGVDGDGVWIICSCVRSGRWATQSDAKRGMRMYLPAYGMIIWNIYIYGNCGANALILLEISSGFTRENK